MKALRTLWLLAWRALLAWQIRANEQWLRDCERDGCLSPGHRREVERQQQELRVKHALTFNRATQA